LKPRRPGSSVDPRDRIAPARYVRHQHVVGGRAFGHGAWFGLAGRNQLPIAAQAVAMGGNARVGLEDSIWIGPGQLAESNARQVQQVRKVIEGLGLEVATPDDAREILQLKGRDRVAF
jgi:uncharacterized protein (DUF849 family)